VGVFDSGLGGLTVVRALRQELPNESIVYLGDTARIPYGTRTAATVCRYAEGCAAALLQHGIKVLVVACNTVSAVALEGLSAGLSVPVIGVVEPGARAAVNAARAQADAGGTVPKIGVLCTEGTLRSGAYARAVQRIAPGIEVLVRAAPLFVPLAEEGWVEGDVPRLAAERYVGPLLEQGASVLLLGCTHYPLLQAVIHATAQSLGNRPVQIVDSALATAQALAELLEARQLRAPADKRPGLRLLATDLPASFRGSARRFLGDEVSDVQQVDISEGR
jgi:glutamate racemase